MKRRRAHAFEAFHMSERRRQSTMLEAIHKRELRIWMKRRGLNPRSFRPLVWYPRSEAATSRYHVGGYQKSIKTTARTKFNQ
jgi:hypothetical protein